MKVIDAFWEKRNLGVDAISFQIDKEDSLDEIVRLINDDKREYQTAIIDPTRSDVLLELQNHGFKFMECTLSLSATADKVVIPETLKRFQSHMEYRPASENEIEMIKGIIKDGDVFKTDKISLDPFFGIKKAGIRYSFWIDDLLKTGNTLFVITYKDEVIGFEVAKLSGDTVEAYLGGMLPSKIGRMLGAAMYVPSTTYWKEHGAKILTAVVSSNNPPILKIHESFGLIITDWKYVLIRHSMDSR